MCWGEGAQMCVHNWRDLRCDRECLCNLDQSLIPILSNGQSVLDSCRKSVRDSPNLRLRVLVTGSLYIVGDMLSLLGVRIS